MLILFDQGTPVGLRGALSGHTVKTAYEQGWSTLLNGELLRAAEEAGFAVFVTTDANLPHQQNLTGCKLGIVVLKNYKWSLLQRAIPQIVSAIETAAAGTYVEIEIPA